MLRSVLERDLKLVEAAIDALIELEGVVYENGLPSSMSKSLQDLRSRVTTINQQLDK